MIEIFSLTTIAAYSSFLTAEHFHYSGVIASVSARMFCGNYAALVWMSPSTRVAVEAFCVYVAFALNSIVFLSYRPRGSIPVVVGLVAGDSGRLPIVTLGRGLIIFGGSSAVAKDAGTDSLRRGAWSWLAARCAALCLWCSFSVCPLLSRIAISAGFDDLCGRHSFDPRPCADDCRPLLRWLGIVAWTGGPRRVRVYARRVTGSPRRIAGA